jgi:hypothetical protein
MQQGIIINFPSFKPEKGMTIRPRSGARVPSVVKYGWSTAIILKVADCTFDKGVKELRIGGIANGKEFVCLEYSDNIEEKPINA